MHDRRIWETLSFKSEPGNRHDDETADKVVNKNIHRRLQSKAANPLLGTGSAANRATREPAPQSSPLFQSNGVVISQPVNSRGGRIKTCRIKLAVLHGLLDGYRNFIDVRHGLG